MATKPKPPVERTCACCSVTFQGKPKAQRCQPCVAAGIKQPNRNKPNLVERTCNVCTSTYLGTPKSKRCKTCKDAGRQPKIRICIECRSPFTFRDDTPVTCPSCADLLSIDQSEVSPEQAKAIRAEQRRLRWLESDSELKDWLTERDRTPKGKAKMNQTTAKLPIGLLWLQLCAADGAAASICYAANTVISETDKLALLTSFMRLRVKGYRPDALATLCPIALLRDATQDAIGDLPEVTESEPDDGLHFDPLEDLEAGHRSEIIAFQEQQSRLTDAIQLGLI